MRRSSLALLFVLMLALTTLGLVWFKVLGSDLAAGGWALPATPTLLALIAAAAIYVLGLGCWALIMARTPMSVTYPIGIGASLVTTTLASMAWLGEPVDAARLAGIALIAAGAACVARGKS